MTFQEFLANPQQRSAWVKFENINLYIRRSTRVLGGTLSVECFDFANMDAEEATRGSGNLWRAVDMAFETRAVYFENVLSPTLLASLQRRGWVMINNEYAAWQPSFYKLSRRDRT